MLFYNHEPWSAFQVIARHERKVATILEYRGFEYFLPTCRTRRAWSDRTKVMEEPLFPGYVFCKYRRSLMETVHSTHAIVRIVSFGGKPHFIPDQEIEAIQRITDDRRDVSLCGYLNTGQKVQVITGSLQGIVGIIVGFKGRERLVLSVNPIMKSMSIEIDRAEVALIEQTETRLEQTA